ncbi:hypothetical protein D3C77_607760 [compost metagenome]
MVFAAGMNHSAAAREISLQRAMRVSPIRVPWASIIRASMASPGVVSNAWASCPISSGNCTSRRRAALGRILALVKSLKRIPSIGLRSIRPSCRAWRKAVSSSANICRR